MIEPKLLEAIFGDNDNEPERKLSGRSLSSGGKPFTIWVPSDKRAKYEALPKNKRRNFYNKVRELLLTSIDLAAKKAS